MPNRNPFKTFSMGYERRMNDTPNPKKEVNSGINNLINESINITALVLWKLMEAIREILSLN